MAQSNLTLYNGNNSPLPQPAETEPGYGHLLGVLVRRRNWVLGTLIATLAATAAVTLVMRPTYRSTMQLMVDSNYRTRKATPESPSFSYADPNVEIDNATQLNVMRSAQLLQRAIDDLKPRYPDLTVEKLRKKLAVSTIQEQKGNEKVNTSIFQVTYTESDRTKTRDVLSALEKVYEQYNVEQQKQRLTRGLSFINAQIPQAEARVAQAEAALERFRASQDLIDPEIQSQSLIESLSTLQKDQLTNRATLAAAQAQYGALQGQLGRDPRQASIAARLSQSSRYQALLDEIQKTEVALVQQRLRFTEKTPFVQTLLEQRQQQSLLLRQEAQRILGADAGALASAGGNLVSIGQMGENDLKFASGLVEAQVNFLAAQARDRTLAANEAQLQGDLKRFPTLLAEYNRLQPNVKINRETLEQLLTARQELGLEIARGAFDWQTLEQPRLGRKVGPSWLRNLLAGGALGLMLGSAAALMRESSDDSVRTSEDLTKQLPVPLLGMVPELPLPEMGVSSRSLPFQRSDVLDPSMMQVLHWAPFRESLDLIYKNLQLMTDGAPIKSLVVTSALAGEGKSTVALGLAISAARLHQRVLLIDADLRRPGLHKQLDLPNEQGLSTLLISDRFLGTNAVQNANTYSDLPISVLTAGPTPTDSVKLLSSKRMRDLMSMFEQSYDLVIVDAPPTLGIVDAILAASFCDGALLVGRMGRVTRHEIAEAAHTLNRLNLLGIVANGASNTGSYYYDRIA
ncbi:GumC family protein [Myxacorys almedinensis]|uniref:non-specific protein-tyrosine kinase n=1 Tax=Myxacorys almedinensis A TaxID=2690445 RepID=A0A8J8CKG6_9CYAN|nr:polysaccharide biosynthesis tyrosine autokinase [Myxacorys almedinensis]NDJ16625.1 polysaccharide biosynthesis tyrosine autokinase [Myxacorys almedinensis A]